MEVVELKALENKRENDRRWISRNYSSRRGLVRTLWHQLLFYLGRYRRYKKIDWSKVERLVFVCKGNICRSAYAEAVAKSLACEAISCGVDTIESAPANREAIETAARHGFDLNHHKTQTVKCVTFKSSDLLIAMEPWQVDVLEKHLNGKYQYSLLGLWTKTALPHLQDPYGASSLYFDKCFSNIEQGVRAVVNNIEK